MFPIFRASLSRWLPAAVLAWSAVTALPAMALSTSDFVQIEQGAAHFCGVTTSGAVQCWGANHAGQLGNGSKTDFNSTPLPPVIAVASGATAVSVHGDHSCALVRGAVQCWGSNVHGESGDANIFTPVLLPRTVIASGANAVYTSTFNSCALLQGGRLQCWGSDYSEQLGNGLSSNSSHSATPVTIFDQGVTEVAVGSDFMCAVVQGGLQCWGLLLPNPFAVGPWPNTGSLVRPVTVVASGVSSVSAGYTHACAVINSAVYCWGIASQRQTDPFHGNVFVDGTAVQVTGPGMQTVRTSQGMSCAISQGGGLQCWGNGLARALGYDDSMVQAPNVGPLTLGTSGVTQVSPGYSQLCAKAQGRLTCLGKFGTLGQ